MVKAIIEGRKTQTRRIIKNKIALDWLGPDMFTPQFTADNCAPYQPGDILYVRETHMGYMMDGKIGYWYKASENPQCIALLSEHGKWRPSIHMPAAAARIFLKVTAVKAERLQDITEADAIAEGCQSGGDWGSAPTTEFSNLWQSIYGPESVNDDPWVFAYTFERCDAPTIHRSPFTIHR
jgi:hypothetical protein